MFFPSTHLGPFRSNDSAQGLLASIDARLEQLCVSRWHGSVDERYQLFFSGRETARVHLFAADGETLL